MVRPAWPCRVDHRAPARQRPGGAGVWGHSLVTAEVAGMARAWQALCGSVTVGRVLVA